MTLVAYLGCGLQPKGRTGDGISPIRKTKGQSDWKSIMEREWVCVCVHESRISPAKCACLLSLYAIIGSGRR